MSVVGIQCADSCFSMGAIVEAVLDCSHTRSDCFTKVSRVMLLSALYLIYNRNNGTTGP